ncbi:MAG: hypothetical protein ACOYKN_20315 [Pirellula sp.]
MTAIDDCPPIADGEGSVVTARFVTHEVHVVASVDVLGADGSFETITGTTIHPVWSVDRQEWVPLAELAQGEWLCCDTESFGLGFPSSLTPKASGLVLNRSNARQAVRGADVSLPSGPAARKRHSSNAKLACTSSPVDRSKFGWKLKAVSGGPRVRRREGGIACAGWKRTCRSSLGSG